MMNGIRKDPVPHYIFQPFINIIVLSHTYAHIHALHIIAPTNFSSVYRSVARRFFKRGKFSTNMNTYI